MKRRITMLSLVLALALVFGSFQSVFAAGKTGKPTDATREAIKESGVQTVLKIDNEVTADNYVNNFYKEVSKGGYKLITTSQLKKELKKDVIVDTMPEGWWKQRRIPGSINSVAGAMNGPEFKILPAEKKDLLKKVEKACGKKTVTKYYNKKTKKWQTKKIKGAKTKKVKEVNKDKKIVVYCGFVGCARSHQAAMYLVKQGYKNVYRYAGGISAWVDANNLIEGTDVK